MAYLGHGWSGWLTYGLPNRRLPARLRERVGADRSILVSGRRGAAQLRGDAGIADEPAALNSGGGGCGSSGRKGRASGQTCRGPARLGRRRQ